MSARVNIQGMIVCIENADPGFDWIFTQRSGWSPVSAAQLAHGDTLREFGLPAAIGCGDSRAADASWRSELNCALRPLHAK